MAHKVWTGSINFGLVSIPVDLYAATENHTIRFNQYQRGTSDRVRYRRVNERTGAELGYDDIVKGREVNGTLVTVEPQELDDIAPGRSRTIDITRFVELDAIDPVYFQTTYWLAPSEAEHSRPYALLQRALTETNRAGIATFVLRGKEYLTAVRADEEVLALNTLFFADEVRDPAGVVGSPGKIGSQRSKDLQMATDLVRSMSGPWRPEEHEDTYMARVEQLLQDKSQGRSPQPEQAPPEPTGTTDLTDALRRSTEQARGESSRDEHGSTSTDRQGGAATSAEEVASLTKSELNRRARELGIKGRSKLNRSELERAITEYPGAHRQERRRAQKAS